MVSSAQIIGAVVDDNRTLSRIRQLSPLSQQKSCGNCVAYTQNALGSDQLDELVGNRLFDVALAVRLEVP